MGTRPRPLHSRMPTPALTNAVALERSAAYWPVTWRLDNDQRTTFYPCYRTHYGLKHVEWHAVREHTWVPIENALRGVDGLPDDLKNTEYCMREFFGFLAKVKGYSLVNACKTVHLLSPRLLHDFWEFCASHRDLGGRQQARSTMRTMCTSVQHLVIATQQLGLEGLEHEEYTPANVLMWWYTNALPACKQCDLGQKTAMFRGQADIWPTVQEVVKADMEMALWEGENIKAKMREDPDSVTNDDLWWCLVRIQRGCLFGPAGDTPCLPLCASLSLIDRLTDFMAAGVTAPPLRPACSPTLRQPGTRCPRIHCRSAQRHILRVGAETPLCPGNSWEQEESLDWQGQPLYRLVWRHYKNKDKGGYVGSAAIRIHTSRMLGENWQNLFRLWVTWGREEWCNLCGVDKDEVAYTYLDTTGKPWRSPETSNSYSDLSTWLRDELHVICSASQVFNEAELDSLRNFSLQDAR